MRFRLLAVSLALTAIVCLTVAYINRDRPVTAGGNVEGVYVSPGHRGWTAYAPIDQLSVGDPRSSRFDHFDPWDSYLWLGAGIAFALASVTVLGGGRFASRFATPS